MPLRHITLRQLKVFDAVARALSFSRAAEVLHLTQPAVSMQVRELETRPALALFERRAADPPHRRRRGAARFTRGGAARAQGLRRHVRGDAGASPAGALHLAVVSTAKYFAPRLLAEFARRHPGVT